MFKLYPDIEKELFYDHDYKPLPELSNLDKIELNNLLTNLYDAIDNAYINHAELLCIALYDDILTVQEHLERMAKQNA